MIIPVFEGERLLRAEPARWLSRAGAVRGALCVTDLRVLFARQGEDEVAELVVALPLEAVARATPYRALGLVPVGLRLELADGPEVRFAVGGGGRWAAFVEAARRGDAEVDPVLDGPEGPLPPVVSPTAVAAWILVPLSFVPLLGLLPALALLALGLLLALRPRRELDRRTGLAAAALGGVAVAVVGFGLLSLLVQGRPPEPPAAGGAAQATASTRVLQIAVLIASVVFHECGHGLAALWAGDPTARRAGRLTLNPFPHVDLFGSLILPALLIFSRASFVLGWAKPVPVDPTRYRRPVRAEVAVSLAGVSANLALALACASLLAALGGAVGLLAPEATANGFWVPGFRTEVQGVPGALAIGVAADVLKAAVVLNLVLLVFNLLPVPPLDGSHLLALVLPRPLAELFAKVRSFGFVILVLLLVTGALDPVFGLVRSASVVICYAAGAAAGLG